MQIHLMRHAIAAEPSAGSWRTDAERPLTETGIRKMKREAEGLLVAGIAFDRIVTSPYVRARETARIVARVSESRIEPEEIEELAPGLEPERLWRRLRGLDAAARVLLVGHEPDMGLLAAQLLGLAASQAIPFRKGGVARIDVDALPPTRPGSLIWMLTPSLARALRG